MSLLAQGRESCPQGVLLACFQSPGEPSKSFPLLLRENPSSCHRHIWPNCLMGSLPLSFLSELTSQAARFSALALPAFPHLRTLAHALTSTPKALTVTVAAFFSSFSS